MRSLFQVAAVGLALAVFAAGQARAADDAPPPIPAPDVQPPPPSTPPVPVAPTPLVVAPPPVVVAPAPVVISSPYYYPASGVFIGIGVGGYPRYGPYYGYPRYYGPRGYGYRGHYRR